MKTYLHIEDDAKLRRGFGQLIENYFGYQKAEIVMGGGYSETIKKYRGETRKGNQFLLIDSDVPYAECTAKIEELGLTKRSKFVFFMVQEMEAWFLSQPEIIEKEFNLPQGTILNILDGKKPEQIESPKEVLSEAINNLGKQYEIVKSAVVLLPQLNLKQLSIDFPDVANLLNAL